MKMAQKDNRLVGSQTYQKSNLNEESTEFTKYHKKGGKTISYHKIWNSQKSIKNDNKVGTRAIKRDTKILTVKRLYNTKNNLKML